MDDNLLDRFEQQVDSLLTKYELFKQENAQLREKQALLMNENSRLQVKNEKAINVVEKIVEKLKFIESEDVTGT